MWEAIMGLPYRSPAAPAAEPENEPRGFELPDAELLVAMVLTSPIFLAVVIRTALNGEAFGASETICGAMVAATAALGFSAWRGRKTRRPRPPSRER
jgi:hypothetical protein